jgi:hypothetical protein
MINTRSVAMCIRLITEEKPIAGPAMPDTTTPGPDEPSQPSIRAAMRGARPPGRTFAPGRRGWILGSHATPWLLVVFDSSWLRTSAGVRKW